MGKVQFILVVFLLFLVSCGTNNKQKQKKKESLYRGAVTKENVLDVIKKVNDYWQSAHPNHGSSFWHQAAYHTGNLAAYNIVKNESYLDYSIEWAKQNQWMGAHSNNSDNWKYSYGETDDFVLFGDWQACFQVYIDLYELQPEKKKIARAREVMEYQMSTLQNDYWWWADGLYMVMPVMTRLYKATDNPMYLDKLYEYFSFARNLMHDKETGLFFRDGKYVFPKHKTNKGLKDFWARGNGWVCAALSRVLEDLPKTDSHREEYIQIFRQMAETLAESQQEQGYWTRSMLDPNQAPGPETSGTAFFTYGLLWGINNNLLDKETYFPVVEKSWAYLTQIALQADGKLGYVQPIGEKAIPGQIIDANSTADFGVGAFLLAASEMARFVDKH